MTEQIDYKSSGIDYEPIDKLKVYAQIQAALTGDLLERHGFTETLTSRGESAYVFDVGEFYVAFTNEGLGTKNIVAEDYDSDKSDYWRYLAQDTIATIVNDLATVGATPVTISPHWAVGESRWFENENRSRGLVDGWKVACEQVGASYAGGETAVLPQIIEANTVMLSGAAIGIIRPKERLVLGEKIRAGDSIVLIESSGIHANGLTLARRVAEELPLGYETKLSNGKEYGDALLTPTHLYSPLVDRVLEEGLDIHYMVNMTGHGWRKLMRANRPFVYQVHTIPRPQEEFDLIKRTANLSYKDMYETFNMGAGYAFMLPGDQAETLLGISESFGLEALFAGQVRHGEKKVVIEPKQIIFDADSLQIK